jgi:APA family basic amino acid/polyamine antiporter
LLGLDPNLRTPIAVAAVVSVTGLVIAGIRRTAGVNSVLVGVTLGALGVFLVAGVARLSAGGLDPLRFVRPASGAAWWRVLPEATALMFVAYTGYGRIATLGEEVRDPGRTIQRAVIVTLAVSALLYTSVAIVGWEVGGTGWRVDGRGSDPIAPLAALIDGPAARLVEVGALAAMVGVLVNLVLGLSRVWLAMGRRGDLPRGLAVLDGRRNPTRAVVVAGAVVGSITLLGDLRLTWSFSAFTVLLYYALTNAAALQLPVADRRAPKWIAWAGLASCAFLALWLDGAALALGLGILGAAVLGRLSSQAVGIGSR